MSMNYGNGTPPGLQKDAQWYYASNNQQVGPIPYISIRSLIESRVITPDTLVWREGMVDWLPAKQTELFVSRSRPSNRPTPPPQIKTQNRPLTAEEIEARKNQLASSFKKNAKIYGIVAGIIVFLIILSVITGSVIPKSHYNKGMAAFESGDYRTAVIEFAKAKKYSDAPEMLLTSQRAGHYQNGQEALAAGDYDLANTEFLAAVGYMDADVMAETSLLQGHYVEGTSLFESGDYEAAAVEFAAANGYEDAVDRSRESYYLVATDCYNAGDFVAAAENYGNAAGYEDSEEMIIFLGDQCLANEDYTNAVLFYGYSSDARYVSYAQGVEYMSEGNFDEAISAFEGAEDLNDTTDKLLACHYSLGVQNLIEGNYTTAASHFDEVGTFNGGDVLLLVAQAEDANSDSHLATAVENYSQVPSDFSIEGFDVQARRSVFTSSTASSFAALCADYSVESNTINCTDEGPYGYTNGWSLTDVVPDQNLNIDCQYADGSYVLTGSVRILVMTEYSILRDYVDGDYYYHTFEMTDLTSVPSSFSFDDDTVTLTFSGNQVTAHYRVVDNYAIGWEYVYDTKTTFVRE